MEKHCKNCCFDHLRAKNTSIECANCYKNGEYKNYEYAAAEWVSVEELLPKAEESVDNCFWLPVLVEGEEGWYKGIYYKKRSGGYKWIIDGCVGDFKVTHWFNLPKFEGKK